MFYRIYRGQIVVFPRTDIPVCTAFEKR